MGNHDIELALPSVRRKLKEVIGVKPYHDYEFICNGEAYEVGEALIEHGNRYDQWNVVNYDNLRHISSRQSRRQEITEKYKFDPPAGSKMVSWVINEIKEEYKFIDLLKPETEVAFPLLMALEPGYWQLLATVAKLGLQSHAHRLEGPLDPLVEGDIHAEGNSTSDEFLSDMSTYQGEDSKTLSPTDDNEAALEVVLQKGLGKDCRTFLNELSPKGTKSDAESGGDISTKDVKDRTYGLFQLLLAHNDQDIGSRMPALLKALQALQPDRNFDQNFEAAAVYTDAATELFKAGYQYVIFGHTDLAKKIELQPDRWYLNSGTWSDLIRLPDNIIDATPADARKVLDPFVQDLGGGYLDRWIVFHPTYIQLDLDANNHIAHAELLSYQGTTAFRG